MKWQDSCVPSRSCNLAHNWRNPLAQSVSVCTTASSRLSVALELWRGYKIRKSPSARRITPTGAQRDALRHQQLDFKEQPKVCLLEKLTVARLVETDKYLLDCDRSLPCSQQPNCVLSCSRRTASRSTFHANNHSSCVEISRPASSLHIFFPSCSVTGIKHSPLPYLLHSPPISLPHLTVLPPNNVPSALLSNALNVRPSKCAEIHSYYETTV